MNDIATSDIAASGFVRPLGGLPAADRMLLIKLPLELVIAEVRFVPPVTMITDKQALAVQKFVQASGFAMPQLQPAQEASVEVAVVVAGQPMAATQQVSRGWQLKASDPPDTRHRHARSPRYPDGGVRALERQPQATAVGVP